MPTSTEEIRYHPECGWRLQNGDLLVPFEGQDRRGVEMIGHRHPQFRSWSPIVRQHRLRWQPLHALHHATTSGDVHGVKAALDAGAPADGLLPTSTNRCTPLLLAVPHGSELVLLFLRHGANVNHPNDTGWTPLMIAASRMSPEVVALLLEHGADPLPANDGDETALTIALDRQNAGPAAETPDAGADREEREQRVVELLTAAQPDGELVTAAWHTLRAESARQWHRSFRRLYHQLEEYDGTRMFEEVLQPFTPDALETMVQLQHYKRMNPVESPDAVTDEDLYEWYALGRVNDFLLLGFQQGQDLDWDAPFQAAEYRKSSAYRKITGWAGPYVGRAEYLRFFATLGFEVFNEGPFRPFLHEVVEVIEDEACGSTVFIDHIFWPGLIFGNLLFSRAGVRVRCSRAVMAKELAERSTLYFTFWRRRREVEDRSVGWGHNSQWRTQMRRDYLEGGYFHYNVDGKYNLDENYGTSRSADGRDVDEDATNLAERIEMLTNRCLVRAHGVEGAYPYDDRYSEPA